MLSNDDAYTKEALRKMRQEAEGLIKRDAEGYAGLANTLPEGLKRLKTELQENFPDLEKDKIKDYIVHLAGRPNIVEELKSFEKKKALDRAGLFEAETLDHFLTKTYKTMLNQFDPIFDKKINELQVVLKAYNNERYTALSNRTRSHADSKMDENEDGISVNFNRGITSWKDVMIETVQEVYKKIGDKTIVTRLATFSGIPCQFFLNFKEFGMKNVKILVTLEKWVNQALTESIKLFLYSKSYRNKLQFQAKPEWGAMNNWFMAVANKFNCCSVYLVSDNALEGELPWAIDMYMMPQPHLDTLSQALIKMRKGLFKLQKTRENQARSRKNKVLNADKHKFERIAEYFVADQKGEKVDLSYGLVDT